MSAVSLISPTRRRSDYFPELWMPLAAAWLLMSLSFSIVDDAPGGARLDSLVSLLKYALRAVLNPILLGLCLYEFFRRPAPRLLLLYLPLLAFCGWAIVSTVWSPLKVMSLGQSGSLLLVCLLSLLLALRCHSPRHTEAILFFLCAALLVLGAGLLVLRVCVPSLTIAERETTGLFHALNVAATASLGMILCAASAAFWGWKWTGPMLLLAIPVHGLLLFLSVSRLGVALTCVVMLGLLFRRIPVLYAAGSGFAICCVGILTLTVDPGLSLARSSGGAVQTYVARGQSASELSALSGREEMWDVMWDSFREAPLTGHGYFVSSASGELEVWHDEGNFTAHNVFLQTMVSTGVIGLVLFVWGIGQVFAVSTVRNALSAESRGLARLLAVLSVWYLAWGMMNDSIAGPIQPETIVLYSLLGLAAGQAFSHGATLRGVAQGANA